VQAADAGRPLINLLPAKEKPLRQLQRFFEEHDTGKAYAGLRRVGADDGTAIWTLLEDDNEIKAALETLEKRAKERRAEARRSTA